MTAPTLIETLTFESGHTATESVTFDLDALALQYGDVLFVDLSHAYDGVPTTPPTGWETVWDSSDATSLQSAVFWYVSDGTETGTITFTLTDGTDYRHPNAVLNQWRGVDTNAPVNAYSGPSNNYAAVGRLKNINAQSITTTVDDCIVVAGGTTYIGQRILGATTATVAASLTGTVSDAHYCDLIVAYQTQASAGATGTTQLTSTNESPTAYWTYWRYAIAPAQLGLTADDIESASGIEASAITQVHDLGIAEVVGASEIETPSLSQVHGLTAADLESVSEIGTPALSGAAGITADDIEATGEIGTPSISQVHHLAPDDNVIEGEAYAEVDEVTLTQVHALIGADLESASESESPALSHMSEHADAPPVRTATVAAQNRTATVVTENRTATVAATASRTATVAAQNRTVAVS